jgi:hypothetical protein
VLVHGDWADASTGTSVIKRLQHSASAHITRVKAGHLTPITRPAEVTKVILSAVDATT